MMNEENREPGMSKFNRVLWYIMGVMTLVIFVIVFIAIVMRGSGY